MWKFSDYLSAWSSPSAFTIPYSPPENSLKQRWRQLPNNVTAFQGWDSLQRAVSPPCQDCHPYYYTSNNNDDNIKLNHSIAPEELGGKGNVCTLVFFGFLGLVQRAEGKMLEKQESHPIIGGSPGWFTDNNSPTVMLCPIVISLASLLGGHI